MGRPLTDVMTQWDSVAKTDILEKKIRVSWLPSEDDKPGSATATPVRHLTNGVGGPQTYVIHVGHANTSTQRQVDATPEAAPPAYSSPREDDTGNITVVGPAEPSPEIKQEAKSDVEYSPSVVSHATISSVKDTTVETLKAQLAQAQATIASLKEAATEGLRQRKAGGDESSSKASNPAPQLQQAIRQGIEGVPVQTTAILCLLSFLLAYFFF